MSTDIEPNEPARICAAVFTPEVKVTPAVNLSAFICAAVTRPPETAVAPIRAPTVLPEAYVAATNVPADVPSISLPNEAVFLNAEPVGADVTRTLTVTESLPPALSTDAAAVRVIGVLCTTPTCAVGIVPTVMEAASIPVAAEAGATDVKTPKPKAATVTSATRLKVVFVDICFLSISQDQEFPVLGFELIS
jgi:hypothetical protein